MFIFTKKIIIGRVIDNNGGALKINRKRENKEWKSNYRHRYRR